MQDDTQRNAQVRVFVKLYKLTRLRGFFSRRATRLDFIDLFINLRSQGKTRAHTPTTPAGHCVHNITCTQHFLRLSRRVSSDHATRARGACLFSAAHFYWHLELQAKRNGRPRGRQECSSTCNARPPQSCSSPAVLLSRPCAGVANRGARVCISKRANTLPSMQRGMHDAHAQRQQGLAAAHIPVHPLKTFDLTLCAA
jgi:hypothetical protein|eukprot:6347087-Prymnesium_polylepis.1